MVISVHLADGGLRQPEAGFWNIMCVSSINASETICMMKSVYAGIVVQTRQTILRKK